MSKMGLWGAVSFSLALVSLTQIRHSAGESDCHILSATSFRASSIEVKWETYVGATYFLLDLRIKDSPRTLPVVTPAPSFATSKVVNGLIPGTEYKVTLKVFNYYNMICMTSTEAVTVPDTAQILEGRALSSSSIYLRWSSVPSARQYFLEVHSHTTGDVLSFSYANVTTDTVVENLQPSTEYDSYMYTSNQAGLGSSSKVSTITTLVQPPVGISATQTAQGSARITWQPVNHVLLYQVKISDSDDAASPPSTYNVTDTQLDIQGILPCSNYLISVSSFNKFLIPSEPNNHTYTTNKLTPVSSVSVDYSCTTNSVVVSWSAVFGADSYKAMAVGTNGTRNMCTSAGTSCHILGLSCNQNYAVHVTPVSENCENHVNATSATFHTVPCPPSNLNLVRECSKDVINFSWNMTENADHYYARAVDSMGRVHPCLTQHNFCNFTRVVCGRQYDFTVYSISGNCRSNISSTLSIRTAPCIPQNLRASANCSSDVLLSTWDHSEGAQYYMVAAIGNRRNSSYSCMSQSNSCAMEGVMCGENLSINITAFDTECSSPPSLGLSAETVPCTPYNVSAEKQCGSDSIQVSWNVMGGVLLFVAMARDDSGRLHSCNSMSSACRIGGLMCSTRYDITVLSSNFMCNSSESDTISIETAACPPDNLMASLDCAANQALVSWRGEPEMNSFTATMVDEDQGLLSCSSANTSCRIPNLKCGQIYTVTVSHHDGVCPSMPSDPIYMESVPCGPASVMADVDCESGAVTFSWMETTNAEGYTTVISDSDTQRTFNSTEAGLSVTSLDCGTEYTVRVTSFDQSCTSLASQLTVKEAPCVPINVVTERSCNQAYVNVTWSASRGADNYTATAVDEDRNTVECLSSDTQCRLEGITCGNIYDISVTATDDTCTSTQSATVELQTEPCPPTGLTASLNCSSNSVMLEWTSSPNAASYIGEAVSSDLHIVTCEPGLVLGCHLEGLNCGSEYVFTVAASDGECQSVKSEPVRLTTAPCVVQSVTTSVSCSNNILTVGWTSGSTPVVHNATAEAADGTTIYCLSEDSSCMLTNLRCGQQYTVSVTASSSMCEGPSSVPEVVNSVPCVPVNVDAMVECSTNILQAFWDAADGAASYISTLTGTGGFSASCPTSSQNCQFSDLQCANEYVFSVIAVNDRCNSSSSVMIPATTAPCDPTDVSASLDCASGVATVAWTASAGADYYSVVADGGGLLADSCSSSGVFCELRQLQCGADYTVTVLARDERCNSSVLATTSITTAPCSPVIQDHSLDCGSNNASITWLEDEYATSVMVNAISNLGHSQSCSSSSSNMCVLDRLQCGHTYTVQAVAQGVQCLSEPSSSFQIITAPCTPQNVEYQYSCGTGITFINWDETLGRESFYIYAVAGDHMSACSTTQTDCSLSSLLCSRLYTVHVIAVAPHCNSSQPGAAQIQTAPCAPINVATNLICDNNTVAVSWNHSAGAMNYHVQALGRDGDVKRCSTNETSCLLPNMHCAQIYTINIIPFSYNCEGTVSDPHSYIAGPCPPTDVQVSLQCVGNVGLVTWNPPRYADRYEVTAVTSDAYVYNCSVSSSGGDGCSLTDLHCGETAVVTVVTEERGCRSEASAPVTFQSVICPPSGLTGVTTCSNNDITVGWDPSPESGVQYFVTSREDSGAVANFSTAQTSHVISGLQCGQMYTLQVAAADSECSSLFSQPIHTDTAPCPPTNLTVKTECGTNSATLAWAPSEYATSYTATVTGTHGHTASCSSNSTLNCSMAVDCGHQYSGVVVASSDSCNSSVSATLTFDSAPCLPDRVQAELDCDANSFMVQWRGSVGDVGTYTAIAIGSDGSRQTCDSFTNECTIQDLRCGLMYGIVVTTSSVDCGVIEGSNYNLQSAPCRPDSLSVDLQCSTGVALVTWGNSGPDQTQVVSAEDSRGTVVTCSSNSTNCTLDQLACGWTYTVSVVGNTDTCSSEPTVAQQLNTAPCVPTHLEAHVDCNAGITVVTWDSALGATSYTVYVSGSLGYSAERLATDTNFGFSNLPCGQTYNITVVASHDTCDSLVSETITATSGPCPQSGLQATLNCSTNTAVVSWIPGSGILHYNASAVAFDVQHRESCSTTESSCNISNLLCGESYKVSVSGQGLECPSPGQDWHRINAVPCPPTQLSIVSSCDSNNIFVSWQASQGSVSYTVTAEGEDGRQWSCDSTGTSCEISGLVCGQQYHVYVVGIDENCAGTKSDVQMIRTAPCVPTDVREELDCLSGLLNVSWASAGHVTQFRASVASSEGDISICTRAERYCVFPELRCGLTYDIAVAAQDDYCNSSLSTVVQVATAPCPLPSFLPTVDCSTGVVSVTWDDDVSGVSYTVHAVDILGRKHNCTGTNMGCDLEDLECGTEYNVSITPSRDGCVGTDSPIEMIKTVPCVPHLSEVEIDCLANSAWVMFNESSGAEDYLVVATDGQGVVQTFPCNVTTEAVCSLPPLMCSQTLTFTLQAQDQQCSSADSNAITTDTGPCPPDNVTESVDCDDRTITVAWSSVPGALSYVAMLEEVQGGQTTCCTTSDTSCSITDLPCGQMYVLHVTAEGRTCNSSQSEGLITRTVPCVPEDLASSLSCSDNVASMSWSHSDGGQLYTVTAVGDDGHSHQCTSPGNHCDLTDLHCGELYTATVTAEDSECRSDASDNVTIKTVPCTPAFASSTMDCETNSLVVSWLESAGADSYIATLQDSDGRGTTCQGTTEGSCSVSGVGCGQIYHVYVVASDGHCDSPPTPETETPSAPCEPTSIMAVVDCYTHTALVSWFQSNGATMYLVTATTSTGLSAACESNVTNCELEGLMCGESYAVSVIAVGESCNSSADMTGELVTEPCIPEFISTQYSITIGQVQWDVAAGAEYYFARGVTEQGLVTSCNSTDTYCPLYNMRCGQTYNITVTANNAVCTNVSTSLEEVSITTEPCPPNNVQTNVDCHENVGIVSWEASNMAVSYVVQLAGRDGHSLSCSTNDTFCNVDELHCDIVYHTSVIAVGETLSSSSSTTVLLVSAPCLMLDMAADLDCDNNTATVSWTSASRATSYLVTAVSSDGYWDSCETDGDRCDLTELQCGQIYNVTMTTISDHCQIETQTDITLSTRPCKPQHVGVDLQCGTSTAVVHWEEEEVVELYVVTGRCSMGEMLMCNSSDASTCTFSNLHCGETYEFTVSAFNGACSSEVSSTVEVQTEPCQPTGLALNGTCNNDTVELDWSEARGASVYVVTASGDLGYTTTFQTPWTYWEVELPCGQVFTFTVVAQDERCNSAVSTPEEYKTGPCVPEHVESYIQCEDSLGAVSWTMSTEADSYLAIAMGLDGHTHECISNTTSCTWDDLHCGEHYIIRVIANDYLCTSLPSNSASIHMAPCIPQNLTSSFNCTTKVGSLAWDASETAELYIVTAETNSGHTVQLSTNDTWTFISEFQCGSEYFLSVQAADSVCTSQPSQPAQLQSEPCPPTGVSSFTNCVTDIVVVSWSGSSGAEFYTATLTMEDGQSKSCWSDSEHCGLPNVYCGQNYTVTVVASNTECDSDPSEPDTLQSVPCVPTDVEVEVDCSMNQAIVSWSSSDGALSYKASAESDQGEISICETADLSCTLSNLTCGHNYSVQVVAEDDTCSSLPSQALAFNSVPCTPNIGSVVLDCYTNSALLDWSYAEGATSYTATARSPDGHVSSCTSNFTNCELMGLQCGQIYTVITMASNDRCDSPPSSTLQVESVPCPPVGVLPVLDCSSNTAQVLWQPSLGAESYVVRAFGVQEHESGCQTDSESCVLPDLRCSFTYNISVIAVNSVCNVSQSEITQLQAVPCVPQQVEARVVCESGAVAVSWEPSRGATSYMAFARGNGGYDSECSSSGDETTCLFSDVLCGHNYTVTVTGSDGTCRSAESFPVDISTVPCAPERVTAETLCSNDTGVVTWEEEEDVSSHMVQAVGPDGHRIECHSTESSCDLPSMHCGQLYNLTVTAQDGECDNSRAHLSLQSVPCSPTSVKASLHCSSNSAAVTWERASGALSYLAIGVTADGSHWTQCNNTMTFCDMSELRCGQTYNISVFGQDDSCSSVESEIAQVRTAPCPPQDVVVDSQCAAGAILVSWSPNPDAQYFHVAAVSDSGARLYCNSTGTACTMDDLPCGQSYNVTVISVRDGCESITSPAVETCSAPCVPWNPSGRLDCVSNSAWVIWDPSNGATSYFVLARASNGLSSNCTSASSPCEVPDLECGTLYTFHVTAVNEHCRSNHSTTFELETGPCALQSISATTDCGSNTVLVEWEQTLDTPLYLVTAEAGDQTLLSCNSSSNSCILEDIRCGTHYSIIVSASSDKCSSLRSPPKKIRTAPCVPDNVMVVPSCEDNGATVTWAHSSVARSYHLNATGEDGLIVTCDSSVNNCSLALLHCGQTYSLSITARGDNCTSPPGTSSFTTVPCAPSGLTVDLDCQTHSASLSWDSTDFAVEYFSCAQPADGAALYCNSTDSSCIFEGLECGDVYNLSVMASDGVCNSSFSAPLQAGAAPCPPTYLNVRMQKIATMYWAMISWDEVNCSDVEYLMEVSGHIQNNPQMIMTVSSYWLPRPYFEVPVPCSTTFNATVTSRNMAGVSEPSSPFPGVSAPCAPQNVRYSGNAQSALLSWDASVLATGYAVYDVSGGSRVELCSTAELSCQLNNFNPGATEVTASNAVGESNASQNITGPELGRRRRDLRAAHLQAQLE